MALDTLSNVRMGRCTGTFGGATIGLTDGGTTLTITNNVVERFIDKYGKTPIRAYDVGTRVEVKTAIGEHAVEAYDMLVGFTTSSGKAVVGGSVGAALTTAALVLSAVDTSDPCAEITINEAYAMGDGDVLFSNDGHRNVPIKFTGIIDSAESNGEMLAKFGAAATLPAITSVKIKDTSTALDEATDVAVTADFDVLFDKQVYPGVGGNWATNGGGVIILINITDDSVTSLTFTDSLVSATEHHVYVNPGTMGNAKNYELIISKFITSASGLTLAANTKYDFVTVA